VLSNGAAIAGWLVAAGALLAPHVNAAELRAVQIGTFVNPVYVTVAPGFPRLVFVVERRGAIQVMQDEVKATRPFLDIRDIVRGLPDSGAGAEQGLLSVAFPEDYAQSRLFYVAFNNNSGAIEIDEFRRHPTNPRLADVNSRRVVLTIPHSGARNHNGGQLQFGPDKHLYISTGDGGHTSTPGAPAPDLESLLGKILRINPKRFGAAAYRIPSDNPFVNRAGRDEIYAYGLRNPWRFSFDQWRLAISDVGQQREEEVNILAKSQVSGVNFGWPEYEGNLPHNASLPGEDEPTFPIFVYSHDTGGCAIVGGYIIRDPALPDLAGRYLYGDSCTGDLRTFVPYIIAQEAARDRTTGLVLTRLTSFGRGFNGQLYAAQLGGQVSRLEPIP
jgi:glucose/arabinose dehydrogenase